MSNNPTLLITGSSGLLGYEFISRFKHDYEIVAITHSQNSVRLPSVQYVDIDFSAEWSVRRLPSQVDFILHLAQSPKFREFPSAALEVFNVNLSSTIKLLDYAVGAKIRKFVFASTGGIYGSSSSPISVNSEILSPTGLSHYFGSKLSAEMFANNYRDLFFVDINRIFFMYGPRQSKNMLIPRLIDSVQTGKIIQLAGENGISINPVFVGDVAHFLNWQLQEKGSAVYNVAGPEVISIKDLVILIQEYFGGVINFEMIPASTDIVADAAEFLSKLDDRPTGIATGIAAFRKYTS